MDGDGQQQDLGPDEEDDAPEPRRGSDVEALQVRLQLLEEQLALVTQSRNERSSSKRRRPESASSSTGEGDAAATPQRVFDPDEYMDIDPPYIDPKTLQQHMMIERMRKPAEPKEYNGGNVAECREFIRSVEGVFRMQPHIYYTQNEKFQYAEMRIKGRVATNWVTQERYTRHAMRWVRLKEWLLNQVQDPNNRSVSFMIRLFNHKQRDTQRVEDFATYLETAEQEVQMEGLTETQRMCLLIAGLQPALRERLMDQHAIPYTRAELLPLLSRLEANLRKGAYGTQTGTRRSGGSPPGARAGDSRDASRIKTPIPVRNNDTRGSTTASGGSGSAGAATQSGSGGDGVATSANRIPLAQVTCYNCGGKGHYSPSCPHPRKNARP